VFHRLEVGRKRPTLGKHRLLHREGNRQREKKGIDITTRDVRTSRSEVQGPPAYRSGVRDRDSQLGRSMAGWPQVEGKEVGVGERETGWKRVFRFFHGPAVVIAETCIAQKDYFGLSNVNARGSMTSKEAARGGIATRKQITPSGRRLGSRGKRPKTYIERLLRVLASF